MRHSRVLGFIFLSLIFTACAKKETIETRGTVAIVDGIAKALRSDEVESVCAKTFCEPNYVYYANFGSRRPEPPPIQEPAPIPVPSPSPAPIPVPQPVSPPISEQLDYSRTIINMTEAWKISKGTRNVIVAVVDTGVEVSHRDLANNIWTNERERNGRAGVDDDGNGFVDDVFGWDFANNRPNGLDDNMHGTHCAGIIGAEQNGIGIIGITQNVRIMPLKFLDVSGSGSTDAAVNAINYAVAMGANVISNSWGGGGRSELLDQAIQRAIRAGIIVVAAAGNDSSNNDSVASFPANYSGVIAVASTDQRDNLSSFSNFGVNRVAIAAPGTQILSTVLNGNWNVLSGTSMATPQVAGAIALAMSARPGLPVDLHRQALCNSARKILLNRVACGRLDVNNYLNEVLRF